MNVDESGDRLYFLVKDPHWTFLWWEISHHTQARIACALEVEPQQLERRLCIHDVTDVMFDGTNSHPRWDVPISGETDHWYLHISQANRVYCAEVVLSAAGRSRVAVRSNPAHLPPECPSGRFEERYSTIRLD